MVLALAEILRRAVEVQYDHNMVSYRPELYASAGGELLVVAMLLSWALTAVYRPDTIASNPLQDRVGYNNLCVGWDMAPARYVAAPLFGLIIWFENRYMMLDFWRASLTPGLSKVKENIVLVANFLNAVSWTFACLIFVIQADEWPAGHTAAFVQKVVFGYIAYVANFIETDESTHRTFRLLLLCIRPVPVLRRIDEHPRANPVVRDCRFRLLVVRLLGCAGLHAPPRP
mmetsp:Transcript_47248/g.135406  ORF Transcript_47248/g.135406 Transcript_47248/m.135406 type:complete len:229 (+) Transcript_47248:69-755(+)